MAVIEVCEKTPRDGVRDEDGLREYTRVFNVWTNSGEDEVNEIIDHVDMPNMLESYSVDGAVDADAKVVKITPKQDSENAHHWEVTVLYSNRIDISRTRISYKFESYQAAIIYDQFGQPINNSAGVPFTPPIQAPRARLVITIKRQEANFDPAVARSFMFKTNSEVWFGYATGQALMWNIDASDNGKGNVPQHDVTYTIKIEDLHLQAGRLPGTTPATLDGATPWQMRVLDTGFQELISGQLVTILSRDGQPRTKPTLLDGAGRKLASGLDPIYKKFTIYDEADFNNLAIP